MKKFLYPVLILCAAFFFMISCGKGSSVRNQTIILGNWWEREADDSSPSTELEELTYEWRKKTMAEHGFNMEVKAVADWHNMLSSVTTSIMAGRPIAHVLQVAPDWAMSLYRQNLLARLDNNGSVDLKNIVSVIGESVSYNQQVAELFTFNGRQYAFAIGYGDTNSDIGVYFNKRLFIEAGLDPDTPYNMQKDGSWTWENFLDVCKILTRDLDNDGSIDRHALPSDWPVYVLECLVYSNGANYVLKDDNGRFYNATMTAEFIEAAQFAKRLHNENIMMHPAEEQPLWDWNVAAFMEGKVAMLVEYNWRAAGFIENRMADDFGYVVFPKGPRRNDYRAGNNEIPFVIPSVYSQEDVDFILFAVNQWFMPVSDDWKSAHYNRFTDSRAIDETLTIVRNKDSYAFRNFLLIPGFDCGDIALKLGVNSAATENDPGQVIEQVSPVYNRLIDDFNAMLFD